MTLLKTTRRSWFAQTTALLLLLAAPQAVHQVLLSKNMREHFIRPEHNKWKRDVTGDRHLVVQPAGLYGRHTGFPHYLATDILQCSLLTCLSWRNIELPLNGDGYIVVSVTGLFVLKKYMMLLLLGTAILWIVCLEEIQNGCSPGVRPVAVQTADLFVLIERGTGCFHYWWQIFCCLLVCPEDMQYIPRSRDRNWW
jgi:hypothetical protein